MTGARIEVALDDDAAQAVLGKLRALAGDLTPMWRDVGGSIASSTLVRFERGHGPGGVPWKPNIRGGQTLVDSGNLRTSLHPRTAPPQADATGVTVGTNIPYAAVHQFGATIRAKKGRALRFRIGERWVSRRQVFIPPRPFLGIDDDDRAEILAIATDHLREAMGEAGT